MPWAAFSPRVRASSPAPRALGAPRFRPHRDPGGPLPMSGFKRLPFVALLAALAVTPARAQIAGHPVEAAVGAGWQQFDVRDHIQNAPLGNVSLGYRWSTGLTFEGAWLGTTTKRVFPFPDVNHTFTWTGLDLRWSLRDPSEKVTPYI